MIAVDVTAARSRTEVRNVTVDINFHDPIMTTDGKMLGVAQRIYRTTEDDPIETGIYNEHLKVVSMTTGEDFFIPLEFLGKRSADGVTVSLSYREVLNSRFDHEPRYIAYSVGTKVALPA